jgi:tetratricopeptide (TPR) repeat protein
LYKTEGSSRMKSKNIFFVCFIGTFIFLCAVTTFTAQKVTTKVRIYSDIFLTDEGLLPLPENAIELELDFSISDKLFKFAKKIDRDQEGNIHVLDSRLVKILKFDPKGNFLHSFGGNGGGKGRLLQPENFILSEDCLIIQDRQQKRLLIYNLQGEYLDRLRLSGFSHFTIDAQGKFYLAAYVKDQYSPLIKVYSPENKSTSSFGKPLVFHHSLKKLNLTSITVNDRRELFIAFRFFPLVRKYASDHRLAAEYRIDTPIMEAKDKYNLQKIGRGIADPTLRAGYMDVITDIEIHKGKIYLLSHHPRLEILKLKEDGMIDVTYWIDQREVYEAIDFFVSEIAGKLKFYVLRSAPPLFSIDVYKIKEQSKSTSADDRIDEMTETIKANPRYIPAYINRGIEKYNKGDYKEAAKDFSQVIELDPNSVSAYYNRGNCWMKLKRYERAIEDFGKAIDIDSRYSTAYFNRGLALIYKKKYTEAISNFKKSAELNPQLKAKAYEQIRFCRSLIIKKIEENK